MKLLDIVNRQIPPIPWTEGDNIPWNDPGFSQRMLQFHLSQEHDAASRRFSMIDRHVSWIHYEVLMKHSSKILDLGCGPGLYTSRLASLGHTCTGIDYAPAAIDYARQAALKESLACTYLESDLRQADFGTDFDLAMQIYGEFNVFSPEDAGCILEKIYAALKPGGRLLLEVHTYEAVWQFGHFRTTWSAKESGLFSDRPHLLLEEDFWDDQLCVATRRYFVIDAASGEAWRFAASYQAYTLEEYRRLVQRHGFNDICIILDLSGAWGGNSKDFMALMAVK